MSIVTDSSYRQRLRRSFVASFLPETTDAEEISQRLFEGNYPNSEVEEIAGRMKDFGIDATKSDKNKAWASFTIQKDIDALRESEAPDDFKIAARQRHKQNLHLVIHAVERSLADDLSSWPDEQFVTDCLNELKGLAVDMLEALRQLR
jgi:hypothetical protein